MLQEFFIGIKLFMLLVGMIGGFFGSIITIAAVKKCGMPGFFEDMPKADKGWFIPFTGLTTRFDAFGHKNFYFPIKVYGKRISYTIARIMAMYLDYFTLSESRTYGVIYGIERKEVDKYGKKESCRP